MPSRATTRSRCISIGGVRFTISWEERYEEEVELLLRHLSPFLVEQKETNKPEWHLILGETPDGDSVQTRFCTLTSVKPGTNYASLRRRAVLQFSTGRSRPRYDVARGAFVLKREWLDYGFAIGLARAGFSIAHGAAVALNHAAILLVGPDGAGKTTAARTLQQHIADSAMIADNYIPLTSTECLAFPGAPRIGFDGPVPRYDFAQLAGQAVHRDQRLRIAAVISVGGSGSSDALTDDLHTPNSVAAFRELSTRAGVPIAPIPPLGDGIPVYSYDYTKDDLLDLVAPATESLT